MSEPIYSRCRSCHRERYQCNTQSELGYGRCCFHCDHRRANPEQEGRR